jgi:hypothetical protein
MLGSDTHAFAALLDRLGVIGDQDRVSGSQTRHHIVADLIAEEVGIPDRAVEQVLERTWGGQSACSARPQEFFLGTSASNARSISPNAFFGSGRWNIQLSRSVRV